MSDLASGATTPPNASNAEQLKAADEIALIDHTTSVEDPEHADQLPDTGEDGSASTIPTSEFLLKKKWTRDSFHQQLARRKYAHYQEDRYEPSETPEPSSPALASDDASAAQQSYIDRGRTLAKGLLKRKKTLRRATEDDAVVETLYENQRGAFLFGVPLFSSSSLLNFDPKPWQNSRFRTSPSDITNAQLPTPGWAWAWPSWYVDMSRDVDEQGWQYSFSFQRAFAWHGTHPWFHSFVRRRRWLRSRVRRRHAAATDAHMMSADYFTVHPVHPHNRALNPADASSRGTSLRARSPPARSQDERPEARSMRDMGTLLATLRRAAVDREKLAAVRVFVASADGDELGGLAAEMPHVMAQFVFASSRRQLLIELMQRCADAARDDRGDQAEHLRAAVSAADRQVGRLEYWSDVEGMARRGEMLRQGEGWEGKPWEGLGARAGNGGSARWKGNTVRLDDAGETAGSSEDSGWVTAATTRADDDGPQAKATER